MVRWAMILSTKGARNALEYSHPLANSLKQLSENTRPICRRQVGAEQPVNFGFLRPTPGCLTQVKWDALSLL